MKERAYPRASITAKGEKALKGGHPWVYADEVTSLTATPADGSLVDVYSNKDKYLGTGFYNSHSKIRIRILSRNANDSFDSRFWERRLRYAVAYRRTVMGETDFKCCRLIFGEADGFPGLTVDRFENVLVAQVLSLGTEGVRDILFPALVRILREELENFGALNASPPVSSEPDVSRQSLDEMSEERDEEHNQELTLAALALFG